jgi:predicted transcriptional regulator of viral defense system
MVHNNNYEKLLSNPSKFFSIQDLVVIWNENDKQIISKLVSYYVKNKKLFTIKRGLYSLIQLNKLTKEDIAIIAQKIITPSYITYHTVLNNNGINFQYYNSIHLMSKYYRKFTINNIDIIFHKANDKVLYNPVGINKFKSNNGQYNIASSERAIIDSWYLNKNQGLDNPNFKNLNKKLLKDLATVYNQPRIWKNLLTTYNIKK